MSQPESEIDPALDCWLFLNRVGWFFDPSGEELSLEAAVSAYQEGAPVHFRGPFKDDPPRVLRRDESGLEAAAEFYFAQQDELFI